MTDEHPADITPILEAIADRAARLCESQDARIFVVEGEALRYVAGFGWVPLPFGLRPLTRGLVIGRAVLDRTIVHVEDMAAAPEEEFPVGREMQRRTGHRTVLGVPLIRGDNVLGVILLRRNEVRPFDPKHIELVKAFADQAAAAIENLQLSTELKARNAELTEALEQQTATAEILKVISGSPTDIQPVLDAVAESAARLCEASDVIIRRVDGDAMRIVTHIGSIPVKADTENAIPLSSKTGMGRAIRERTTIHIHDVLEPHVREEYPDSLFIQRSDPGYRTALFTPLLCQDAAIGVIIIRRPEVRPFSEKQIKLLETFAAQAAIAIENVRLFNETKEALEQQTVTSEILRVISSSPTDTQPVFDAIVKSGVHLFGGMNMSLRLIRGEHTETVASTITLSEADRYPIPLADQGSPSALAIRRREAVQIPDIRTDEQIGETTRERGARRGFRAVLSAPMLKDNVPVGAINVLRAAAGPFTDKQIALLKTFADQAVIAIENVRLFNETKEALEQQTATAEILRVISSSPTDTQPVFDAIVTSGLRLFGGRIVSLRMVKGDHTELAASTDSATANLIPLSEDSPTTRAILRREVVHVPDILAEEWVPERTKQRARHRGFSAIVSVPLLRENSAIGVINVLRASPGTFTDKEIALLRTFADQAVIAIENVRLFNETKEALEQQTVTAEILKVISSSPTDVQPVFEAIVKSGVHLFGGLNVVLRLVKGDHIEQVASTLPRDVDDDVPFEISDGFPSSRAILHREVIEIPDVFAEKSLHERVNRRAEQLGYRAVLAAPMLREDRAVGALTVTRALPGPFTEKQIALLKTFAAQAVIAIENVRLFNETKEALEQQTATADILRVISSSPTDVQPVFDAIVKTGVRLFGGLDVVLRLVKEDQLVMAASTFPADPGNEYSMALDGRSIGSRAVLGREVMQAPDVTTREWDWIDETVKQNAIRRGIRAVLVAPMLRENSAIGAIIVTRATPGMFSEKQVALLKTFADQAVIAIENVRLFKELQARNAEISESLEQQTATAEILRVISSSPTDTQPVFDAIVESGARLVGSVNVSLRLVKGERAEIVASTLTLETVSDQLSVPIRDDRIPSCRAIVKREVVHVPDIFAEDWVGEGTRQRAKRRDSRAILCVPMLREGAAIGAIIVTRTSAGPFTAKQITLLKTFADQAVIAIENVRLFNETKEALEQQTVISEILRVISSSPTDTQPVFDAIVKSGLHIFGGMNVSLRLIKGDHVETVASTLPVENTGGVFPVALGDESFPTSRSMLRREVVQIPDILAPEDWVSLRARQRAKNRGWRSVMHAPLLRENDALGVVSVSRATPGRFTDKQVTLLKTFADQAVIAIENVRLFKELQARNAEITESLEQQTATAEILKVISSSPTDTQPVFDVIVKSGVHLFGGLDVSVLLADGDQVELAASTIPPVHVSDYPLQLREDGTVACRAILSREVTQVPDVLTQDWASEKMRRLAARRGFRAVIAAPLMREDNAIGVIAVTRASPGPFTDKQVALLKTFADQAVIAIENVRLFKELQARNTEITESLEQQTATAEILRVISSSPTDLQPVFQAILEKATRLCDAHMGALRLYEGNELRRAAHIGVRPEYARWIAEESHKYPQLPDGTMAQLTNQKVPVHILDRRASSGYLRGQPSVVALVELGGVRTFLAVPMLKEGRVIGMIVIYRPEVRAFTQKQIDLVSTFAAQAVIAIENVRLFNEIREKGRQLEAANKHKSEFLANMSHELRTPLNAVIGFSEALLEKMFGELNAKQEDYLSDIHSSGRHLLSLINDILDLSKIEAGRMELEPSDFHLPGALKNAMALVRGRAQTHGIALKLRVDPKLGEIRADERKFKQIVVNLLSNAVKFTPDGGHVEVVARKNGNSIKVSVKDTGVGIALKDQATLFEEFRQVGRDAATRQEGTGLGLALARRFVELHGGRISLQSKPGKGSTFAFTLPLSRH